MSAAPSFMKTSTSAAETLPGLRKSVIYRSKSIRNAKVEDEEATGRVLNILLLGETGVGKSTFVNALVNYLKFNTLQEAIDSGKIEWFIPTTFNITDQNYKDIQVTLGDFEKDKNESQKAGASATQSSKCYEFPLGGGQIRIIDAPGIGDTRGIDVDKSNFNDILSFIGQFHFLHGICILLKPNESRLTATFGYCIKQLFCQLAKSCNQNICFVFTNARSTFYRPGETTKVLQSILKDIKTRPPYVEVPFGRNVFCLDSEAFRFLVARKDGVQFDDDELTSYSASWQKSAETCKKLVEYVQSLKPHPIMDTVSLNDARRFIVELSQPLAEILKNIQINQTVLSEKIAELQDRDQSIQNLNKLLYTPIVDVEIQEYDHPMTVCASPKCRQVSTAAGHIKQYYYPQICHNPCKIRFIKKNTQDTMWLKLCKILETGECSMCQCPSRHHMHIYYQLKEVEKQQLNDEVQDKIQTEEQAKEAVQKKVEELKERCSKLEEEQKTIRTITAEFAHFLKNNAITPYNDAFEDYLKQQIENQKSLANVGSNNGEFLKRLQGSLEAYQREKEIIEGAMQNQDHSSDNGCVTVADIFKMKNQLYQLEYAGPLIGKMHNAQRHSMESEHYEKRIQQYTGPVVNKIYESIGWIKEKIRALPEPL